jgi:hypothetical protein
LFPLARALSLKPEVMTNLHSPRQTTLLVMQRLHAAPDAVKTLAVKLVSASETTLQLLFPLLTTDESEMQCSPALVALGVAYGFVAAGHAPDSPTQKQRRLAARARERLGVFLDGPDNAAWPGLASPQMVRCVAAVVTEACGVLDVTADRGGRRRPGQAPRRAPQQAPQPVPRPVVLLPPVGPVAPALPPVRKTLPLTLSLTLPRVTPIDLPPTPCTVTIPSTVTVPVTVPTPTPLQTTLSNDAGARTPRTPPRDVCEKREVRPLVARPLVVKPPAPPPPPPAPLPSLVVRSLASLAPPTEGFVAPPAPAPTPVLPVILPVIPVLRLPSRLTPLRTEPKTGRVLYVLDDVLDTRPRRPIDALLHRHGHKGAGKAAKAKANSPPESKSLDANKWRHVIFFSAQPATATR